MEDIPNIVDNPSNPLKVGDRVIVSGGERPFAGVITGLMSDKEYRVKYYEYEVEVSLPADSLRRLIVQDAMQSADVTIGTVCQCKYSVDQTYYEAVITGITQYGFVVTYPQYGNTEEVPVEYLKHSFTLSKQDSSSSSSKPSMIDKNNSANSKKTGLIPIPENLQILPTDTEEEKERKRKRLKAIKNKNRLIQQEEEVAQVQQSWKKFVEKGSKRSMSGIVKKSMFESSEDVHAKVGVVNSGKGMTNYQERKKHKFEQDESS